MSERFAVVASPSSHAASCRRRTSANDAYVRHRSHAVYARRFAVVVVLQYSVAMI